VLFPNLKLAYPTYTRSVKTCDTTGTSHHITSHTAGTHSLAASIF